MCNTACSGCRSRSLGQGWVSAVGFLVSLASQHPWEPPDLCKVGGSPILGVVEAGHLPCRVVRFSPPVGPGPVSPVHPVCHVPSVAGAVEAFFAGRDLASATCRTYRQALGPLVETVGSDRPVTDLDADRVAAVFEELWADHTPAAWNTRRVAVQAFASWCGERWPLAGDLLVGVGPRRRRTAPPGKELSAHPLSLDPPKGMWVWCRLSEWKALDRLANATWASPASAALAGPVAGGGRLSRSWLLAMPSTGS